MKKKLTVLVTGATGNQGGNVARALIKRGHMVRALTRNKHSEAAQALAGLGAVVVEGDMDQPHQMNTLFEGVDALFLVGNPMQGGVEQEVEQGIKMIDAVKKSGIGHLVYSSVANADQQTGIPHFESKFKIEEYLRLSGIPYTICAPVAFMDNVTAPWSIEGFLSGKIVQALPAECPLYQVSLQNLGEVVASVFEKREALFGHRLDIAGERVTATEMVNTLSAATGHRMSYIALPISDLREQSEDMALMFEWLASDGYSVNCKQLREIFTDVDWQDYGQWARGQQWDHLSFSDKA